MKETSNEHINDIIMYMIDREEKYNSPKDMYEYLNKKTVFNTTSKTLIDAINSTKINERLLTKDDYIHILFSSLKKIYCDIANHPELFDRLLEQGCITNKEHELILKISGKTEDTKKQKKDPLESLKEKAKKWLSDFYPCPDEKAIFIISLFVIRASVSNKKALDKSINDYLNTVDPSGPGSPIDFLSELLEKHLSAQLSDLVEKRKKDNYKTNEKKPVKSKDVYAEALYTNIAKYYTSIVADTDQINSLSGIIDKYCANDKEKLFVLNYILDKKNFLRKNGTHKPLQGKLNRWFIGSPQIEQREMIIKICFALDLSYKYSLQFLNKLGQSDLNIRSEKEAIYTFCLINGRSLTDAYTILDSFIKTCEITEEENNNNSIILTDPISGIVTENNTISISGKVNKNKNLLETVVFTDKTDSKTPKNDRHISFDNELSEKENKTKPFLRLFINGKKNEKYKIIVKKDGSFNVKYNINPKKLDWDSPKTYVFGVKGFDKNNKIIMSASSEITYYKPSGNTTTLLIDDFSEETEWGDENLFIKNTLEKNRKKFIGYSTTAVLEYLKIKNDLYSYILHEKLCNEQPWIDDRKQHTYFDREKKSYQYELKREETPITFMVRSKLKEYKAYNELIADAYYNIQEDPTGLPLNVLSLMNTIAEKSLSDENRNDFSMQHTLSMFYSSIVTKDILIPEYIDSLQSTSDNTETRRKNDESHLNGNILDEFIVDDNDTQFDRIPKAQFLKTSTRKSLIFFYYLNYYLRTADRLLEYKDFDDFVIRLQSILDKCGFAGLNPEDQFDFVILKSIQKQTSRETEYEDNSDFFNSVLQELFSETPNYQL